MRVVGLISGGKDSCFNLMQCVAAGHEIVALANLSPKNVDEMDSYMYQTVGHMGVGLYADAMDLPLYRRTIEGGSLSTTSIDYSPTDGDEVEDLYELLLEVKNSCDIEAVSVGAVLSDYQRIRVENVCQRLGLVSFAYLWRRNQSKLLQEMVDCGIEALVIKVASFGLSPSKHLGKTIKELCPYFEEMKDSYSLNVCGEGGEYETFTLDCPLFKKRILVQDTELVLTSGDVGYLNLTSLKLEDKNLENETQLHLVSSVGTKRPFDFLDDLQLKEEEQQAENQAKECIEKQEDVSHVKSDCCRISGLTDETSDSSVRVVCSPSGFAFSSVHAYSIDEALTKLKSKGITYFTIEMPFIRRFN